MIKVLDSEGTFLGEMAIEQAQKMAEEQNTDLVAMNDVVYKLIDEGRFKYEEKKRQKKQPVHHVKEIKLTPNIQDHDLQTKIRQIEKFVGKGDKVKITVSFRGRENAHKDLGYDLIYRILESDAIKNDSQIQDLGKSLQIQVVKA